MQPVVVVMGQEMGGTPQLRLMQMTGSGTGGVGGAVRATAWLGGSSAVMARMASRQIELRRRADAEVLGVTKAPPRNPGGAG